MSEQEVEAIGRILFMAHMEKLRPVLMSYDYDHKLFGGNANKDAQIKQICGPWELQSEDAQNVYRHMARAVSGLVSQPLDVVPTGPELAPKPTPKPRGGGVAVIECDVLHESAMPRALIKNSYGQVLNSFRGDDCVQKAKEWAKGYDETYDGGVMSESERFQRD